MEFTAFRIWYTIQTIIAIGAAKIMPLHKDFLTLSISEICLFKVPSLDISFPLQLLSISSISVDMPMSCPHGLTIEFIKQIGIIYTQILTPTKPLQFNTFVFTIHVYAVYMGCETKGLCFEFWGLGAVLCRGGYGDWAATWVRLWVVGQFGISGAKSQIDPPAVCSGCLTL
jgi:hypothetical protein